MWRLVIVARRRWRFEQWTLFHETVITRIANCYEKPSHKPSGLWRERVIKRFCPTSDSPEQTNPTDLCTESHKRDKNKNEFRPPKIKKLRRKTSTRKACVWHPLAIWTDREQNNLFITENGKWSVLVVHSNAGRRGNLAEWRPPSVVGPHRSTRLTFYLCSRLADTESFPTSADCCVVFSFFVCFFR